MSLIASFVLLAQTTTTRAQQGAVPATSASRAYEAIRGTKVSLLRPHGFTSAVDFPGFQQRDTGSSVMATQMPAPFAGISAGFTQKLMATRNINLLDKQAHPVGNCQGVLLHATQRASGIVFEKWVLAFGDEKESVLVTATFPQEFRATLSQPLKATVLGTRWDGQKQVDPCADLRFQVDPQPPFQYATRIGDTLMFTGEGKVVSSSKTPIFFSVGYGISDLPDVYQSDHKGFCLKMLSGLRFSHQVVSSISPTTVDGLSGYEVEANGTDDRTHAPVLVYEAILFDSRTYILMIGMTGMEQSAECLPDFEAMAHSFKRKQPMLKVVK